jgi:hypothetical protein
MTKEKPEKPFFLYAVVTSLIIFVSLLTFSSFASSAQKTFDVTDELAHYDYVTKLQSWQIPQWGELLDQRTLRVYDCLETYGSPNGCELKWRSYSTVSGGGYSYQAQHAPLGYLPYVFSQFDSSDPLSALSEMRSLGIYFWSGFIAILMFFLIFKLRVRLIGCFIITLLTIGLPPLVRSISIVNNDASTFVFVFLFLLIALRSNGLDKQGNSFSIIWTSLMLGLSKGFLFLVPLSLFASIFILRKLLKVPSGSSKEIDVHENIKKRSWDSYQQYFFRATIVSLLTYVVFWIVQSMRSISPSSVVYDELMGFRKIDSFQIKTLFDSFARVVGIYQGESILIFKSYNVQIFTSALFFIMLGYVLRSIINLRSPKYLNLSNYNFEKILLVALFILIPLISMWGPIVSYLQGQFDFPTPERYALMIIPFLIIGIAIRFSQETQPSLDTESSTSSLSTRNEG